MNEIWTCNLHAQLLTGDNRIFLPWRHSPRGPRTPPYRGFTITLSYTHHTRQDSSGREIGPSQRPLLDYTHNTHKTETSKPPSGIRTHNPRKRGIAEPRLRPRDHWDRQTTELLGVKTRVSSRLSTTHSKFCLLIRYSNFPATVVESIAKKSLKSAFLLKLYFLFRPVFNINCEIIIRDIYFNFREP